MGPRTLALRHATFELAILCFFPSIKANRVRFVRYDRNQSQAVRQIENLESSLLSKISWSTVSKATDRSSTKSITQRRL